MYVVVRVLIHTGCVHLGPVVLAGRALHTLWLSMRMGLTNYINLR